MRDREKMLVMKAITSRNPQALPVCC